MKHKELLDHLMQTGAATQAQLRPVVASLKRGEGRLVELILRANVVGEVPLARALGEVYNLKVVDIAKVSPKKEALDRAQPTFCRRHSVLPFSVERSTGELLVAVGDPSVALPALSAYQQKVGQKIRIYVAPLNALQSLIDRAYSLSIPTLDGDPFAERASLFGGREVSAFGSVPSFADSSLGSLGSRGSLSGLDTRAQNSPRSANSVDRFFDEDRRSTSSSLLETFGTDSENPGFGGAKVQSSWESSPPFRATGGAAEAELLEENRVLKEQVYRLEQSLQLEINLVRQLVELLLEAGAIDRAAYMEKMSRLR